LSQANEKKKIEGRMKGKKEKCEEERERQGEKEKNLGK
jgi:hypothetical protein